MKPKNSLPTVDNVTELDAETVWKRAMFKKEFDKLLEEFTKSKMES